MAIIDALLPEFDNEMATTRRALERVPSGNLAWKPHEKSMSMGGLATHIANIPSWTVMTIGQDNFDLNPSGAEPYHEKEVTSTQEALEKFDRNVAAARAAISGASDEHLFKNWSLLSGGNTLLTMPRIAVLRGFVMSHNIHHRGQLSVYLRLNNIPVPSIYGPSADEDGM